MLTIRPAALADVPLLRKLIWGLADYEKMPDEVEITEAQLARDGFGPSPRFRSLIAEWHGEPAGFALFFGYYSTWKGSGIFLEDLFVRPDFRGHGIGTALLARVARIAIEEDCVLMRWEVLRTLKSAVELYSKLGGEFLDERRSVRLSGEALRKLAERTSS
ncbi:MAG: GNAT family N-acetyltransferase [Terriglobales bacterium]